MDKSHHKNYRNKIQGKKFSVKEISENPRTANETNNYELGTLDSANERVTITWWSTNKRTGRSYQHATEYDLCEVLKYLITGDWEVIS